MRDLAVGLERDSIVVSVEIGDASVIRVLRSCSTRARRHPRRGS